MTKRNIWYWIFLISERVLPRNKREVPNQLNSTQISRNCNFILYRIDTDTYVLNTFRAEYIRYYIIFKESKSEIQKKHLPT